MNHSLVVTALVSFIALGAQGAFADTGAADASTATAATPAAVSTSSRAAQAATVMPALAMQAGRTRHAARIPGTFALVGADASRSSDAQDQANSIRMMLPPLSGDGGG